MKIFFPSLFMIGLTKNSKSRSILVWLIFPLVYIIIVSLIYFFFIRKELVLYPAFKKNKFFITYFFDGQQGGKTEMLEFSRKETIRFSYMLHKSDSPTYAGISVRSHLSFYLLPRMLYDSVVLKIRGKNLESINLQLKVFQEGITERNNESSYRYCSINLPVEEYYRKHRIKLEDFVTEHWWLRANNIRKGTKLPIDFEKIVAVQISEDGTQSLDTELDFQVAYLSLQKSPVFIYWGFLLILMLVYVSAGLYHFIKKSRQSLSAELLVKSTLQAGSFREMTLLMNEVNAHKKGVNLLDSLSLAQSIQRSILPSEETLEKSLGPFFISWKPRDIVGGDFYWFKKNRSGYFLAEIDCAGHGIPGAFMTMMVHSILERVAEHGDCSSPARMLQRLNRILKESRNYSDAEHVPISGDGLDISLCLVKTREKQLIFSGARQALFYAHRGHINIIWGDRVSIGTGSTDIDFCFTDHLINLAKGDTIYMASDGYLDQDEKAKKLPLGKKRFIELLQQITGESMEEQQRFLESFLYENLKDTSQIDDVTIIGFNPLKNPDL